MSGALQHFERLIANLRALGARRLAVLGVAGLSIMALLGLLGYVLSRPSTETLYAGLEKQDVARIGTALREANIGFDVSTDGASVLVGFGEAARARMLLAEKGLPGGASAGYELFDKLGSLGLTSFMQEVTRLRAIEGELARTIQLIKGVKAARVHIVMQDEGSFRRARQPPSASVIIRTELPSDNASAGAIRHLVAAAIPGLAMDQVTVINSDGTVLTAPDEGSEAGPNRMRALEKIVAQDARDAISRTLTPFLGLKNFQVSVSARVNTDKRQTNETIFNPESRVERSVRVTKENQISQNSVNQAATSVDRNLPQTKGNSDGRQSNEENQKREELTNYELSSKTVTTVSAGYQIEQMSVAVVINRQGLAEQLGAKAGPETVAAQLSDLETLINSAAGLKRERGDTLKVSAVEFSKDGRELEPTPSAGLLDRLIQQTGSLVNAVAALGVAVLLVWFGIRPGIRALSEARTASPPEQALVAGPAAVISAQQLAFSDPSSADLIEDIRGLPRRQAQRRLEQIVALDELQAAAILKQWIHQGEAA